MANERTTASTLVYSGRIFDVYRDNVLLDNSHAVTRELVSHNGGVCVLALDSSDNVLMVRQYRYGIKGELLELPAGKLNEGELPYDCAVRELIEETGYSAESMVEMGYLWPSPAYLSEKIYLFSASSLYLVGQNLDYDELLTVERVPILKCKEMVLSGEIPDAKTQIAVLKYCMLNGI